MANELPPIDANISDRVSTQFDGADAKLKDACKNRKARKKIKPEHFEAIRSGKANSVPATRNGVTSHKQASDTFTGSASQRQSAQQMQGMRVDASAKAATDVIQVPRGFSAPSVPALSLGNIGKTNDVNSLMSLFGSSQNNGALIKQGLGTVAKEEAAQLAQNGQIGGLVQKFTGMEQQFGAKEMAFKAQEVLFKGLSMTFNGISTAMTAASTALTSAASAVDAAASAVAAIPFVGAAISAVLRAVAMMIKGIAQGLKAIGTQMQTMGKNMDAKAVENQAAGKAMNVQKMAAQAKKMANEAAMRQGQARLQQIGASRNQLQAAMSQNMNDQQNLAARLAQLGRQVNLNAGGMGGVGQPGNANAMPMAAGMLAAGLAGQALQGMQNMAMMNQMGPSLTPRAPVAPASPSFGSGGNFGRSFPAPTPNPITSAPAAPPVAPAPPPVAATPILPPPPPTVTPNPVAGPAAPQANQAIQPELRRPHGPHDPKGHGPKDHDPRTHQAKGHEKKDEHDKKAKKNEQDDKNKKQDPKAQKQDPRGKQAGPMQRDGQAATNRAGQMGAGALGAASSVRQDYEARLTRMTNEVEALKKVGGANSKPPGLDDKQRSLQQLYNKVAEEGVEIESNIEMGARRALQGSGFEPSRRINTAQGGPGEGGPGGNRQGQGQGLGQRQGIGLPGQNVLAGQKTPVQPQQQVQPRQPEPTQQHQPQVFADVPNPRQRPLA